jgi:hypothetical protein
VAQDWVVILKRGSKREIKWDKQSQRQAFERAEDLAKLHNIRRWEVLDDSHKIVIDASEYYALRD